MKLIALSVNSVAILLLCLSACGGGGGGPVTQRSMEPPETGPVEPTEPAETRLMEASAESAVTVLNGAATAIPQIGRRGVTQSLNTDSNNLTTDIAEAVFDRGRVALRVTGQDGSSFEINSIRDALESVTATSLRDDQTALNWRLERELGDGTTIASEGFGEVPDEEFPLRAIHAAGNWGTNSIPVEEWEASGRRQPLIPSDHIAYLEGLHVNWVGLSVALHYDDSLDSTVERVYSENVDISTFTDDAIRQYIREFRSHGIDVYLTLAFEAFEAEHSQRPVRRWQLGDPGAPETGVPSDDPSIHGRILPENWPWRPSHPDHERFVAEFWKTYTDQAVHFARIAEEEGVRLFSLGTEVDRLFRTRSGDWPNHFKEELETMVMRVREVYTGLLTYDMHYSALTAAVDSFEPGWEHLWEDLGLDIVGVSAWFPVAETEPSRVLSVEELQARYEEIFQEYLVSLAQNNPQRPVVFLEFGATDNIGAPASPGASHLTEFEFGDENGNGVDDGRETQANIYQALLNVMAEYPGVVEGVFWWDNWISSDANWAEFWANQRSYPIRDKPAEDVVRSTYEAWGDWLTGGYWMQVNSEKEIVGAGAFVDGPELAGSPALPTLGTATYKGIATGGYATEYGTRQSNVGPGTHDVGAYRGDVLLTANFGARRIHGRVTEVLVSGFRTSPRGVERRFTEEAAPYEFVLNSASFGEEEFTGEVTVTSTDQTVEISTSDGSWGGKFSVVPDGEGYPRVVAGTHGATLSTTEGTQASFIGAFVGSTEP